MATLATISPKLGVRVDLHRAIGVGAQKPHPALRTYRCCLHSCFRRCCPNGPNGDGEGTKQSAVGLCIFVTAIFLFVVAFSPVCLVHSRCAAIGMRAGPLATVLS